MLKDYFDMETLFLSVGCVVVFLVMGYLIFFSGFFSGYI